MKILFVTLLITLVVFTLVESKPNPDHSNDANSLSVWDHIKAFVVASGEAQTEAWKARNWANYEAVEKAIEHLSQESKKAKEMEG